MLDEAALWKSLGPDGFTRIAREFYSLMKQDDLIGPMYPQDDWDGAEERFRDFLLMRFGADQTYLQKRGHPRLRARHLPFRVGEPERDRWLTIMDEALAAARVPSEEAAMLMDFFRPVADFMRNQ